MNTLTLAQLARVTGGQNGSVIKADPMPGVEIPATDELKLWPEAPKGVQHYPRIAMAR